ncbi:MAG TPA: efflux RND transporter periplasmic adaptor subunit [Bacteroidota bacterium]|nr:efflux RND transporter periplasmic adaptor subunit [Bacteroidota bacterium]
MTVKIAVAFGAVIALGGVYFGVSGLFESAVEVQLATASYTSPAQASAVLTASGYVVAQRKAAVASKGTGRLVYLGVEEGDRVKANQILARLEDADVIAQLDQARANLKLYEAELREAEQTYNRQKALLEQGLTSQAEFEAAEARHKRVAASIEVARAAVAAAEVALENTRIRAPFDGTVLLKHADVGEIVAPLAGAASSRGAVVTIADMTSLEVEADVSEANIERITPNLPCEITLDAYPQQRYEGYVSKVVPTADRAKATVLVKVKFRSFDDRVLPEMSAKVTFLSKGAEQKATENPVLTVPASAVASRGDQNLVFMIDNGVARAVPVTTGRTLGGLVEITQGIKAGDKVIVRVNDKIRDGAKVVTR